MHDDLVVLTTYSSGIEADVTVAILGAHGIEARAQGNDLTGIFGPGFAGPTARGVSVLVPRSVLTEAQQILKEPEEPEEPRAV